ncbi:D-galactose 1-dehydrogenase [Luteibacter jiangsuensis]|uniref:D-galactose 1-dehydrogenase n=1 Tax=Luteibacter jiangsuensis TaxID=637577 RepID=A0ABT9SUP3_9GAMM|nr:Gfo/Idh/MocA family oxidoreductase [Luteibacter jiangsuensis]MDQ0008711.1 D-galactose 1-dehydrogenase [Luteibacter jiangsuensis]
MAPIRVAVIGLGKIARDQHLPAIANDDDFQLAAVVDPVVSGLEDVPCFDSLDALFQGGVAVDAVVLCTPPQIRYTLARKALKNNIHVFLEKPPGATLAEVAALSQRADAGDLTLFAGWHSRYAAGVEPARAWLAERRIEKVSIRWREDVRVWHPGQEWIWEAGGLGVFDPGINALSIATHILPRTFILRSATLSIPANRAAPIAADLRFIDGDDVPMSMDLDWRQTGPQSWDIVVETDQGRLMLAKGGAVLSLPGQDVGGEDREYAGMYSRFASLIRSRRSDVDTAPLRLVADAFLLGRRETTEAFYWDR